LKASVISDAPKARAIRVSLTNPNIRESMVILLTFAADVKRFTNIFSLYSKGVVKYYLLIYNHELQVFLGRV
jgi:hypothetical protein